MSIWSSMTEVTAEDKPISQILKMIEKGQIAIPSFQRDFVWDVHDVRDFIESLARGHPVGVIILWKPSCKDVTPSIYPIPFDDDYEEALKENSEVYYVLDGQQRLTSLLLMAKGWHIRREGRPIEVEPIYYNVAKGSFVVGGGGIDLHLFFRAFALRDPKAMNEVYTKFGGDWEKLSELFMRITEYRLPVYIMKTSNEEGRALEIGKELSEAFIRINRSGVTIGNFELLASLATTSVHPDVGKELREIYGELKGYGISWTPILRLFCRELGLKQTDVARISLRALKGLRRRLEERGKDEVEEGLRQMRNAFIKMLEAFKGRLGEVYLELIPSQVTLVVPAYYLRLKGGGLSDEDFLKVLEWLVLTNLTGYYIGRTDTRLEKDLDVVKECYAKGFPLGELSRRAEFSGITLEGLEEVLNSKVSKRSGRKGKFLLWVLLALNDADDWTGIRLKTIGARDIALHHIFPKAKLKERADKVANLTFINASINREVGNKSPDEYLYEYQGSIIKHFVPLDEKLWRPSNYDEFLKERVKLIYEACRKLLPHITK